MKPSLIDASLTEKINAFIIELSSTVQDDKILNVMENCLYNCGLSITCIYKRQTVNDKQTLKCYFYLETYLIAVGKSKLLSNYFHGLKLTILTINYLSCVRLTILMVYCLNCV